MYKYHATDKTTNTQLKKVILGFWHAFVCFCCVGSTQHTSHAPQDLVAICFIICSNYFLRIFKRLKWNAKCFLFFFRKFGSQKGLVWPYHGRLGSPSFFSFGFSSWFSSSSSSSSQKFSRHDIPRVRRAQRVPWSLLFGLIGISGAAWKRQNTVSFSWKRNENTHCFYLFFGVWIVTCWHHCWHFHTVTQYNFSAKFSQVARQA